jgi:SET domain-containing protein
MAGTPDRVRGASVRVGKSAHGLGLFAAADIPAGDVVLIFTGELLELDDVLASGRDECYPLQVGPSTYLDLDAHSRIVNHSCEPNAGIRSDRILVSLREIREGEEIVYDYSTTMSERRWTMTCACRADGCRGTVADFHDLPLPLQQRYLKLGVVQSFIVAELWFDEVKAGSWGRPRSGLPRG